MGLDVDVDVDVGVLAGCELAGLVMAAGEAIVVGPARSANEYLVCERGFRGCRCVVLCCVVACAGFRSGLHLEHERKLETPSELYSWNAMLSLELVWQWLSIRSSWLDAGGRDVAVEKFKVGSILNVHMCSVGMAGTSADAGFESSGSTRFFRICAQRPIPAVIPSPTAGKKKKKITQDSLWSSVAWCKVEYVSWFCNPGLGSGTKLESSGEKLTIHTPESECQNGVQGRVAQ